MNDFINEINDMTLEQVLERKQTLETEIRDAKNTEALEGMEEKINAINERIAELKDLETRKAQAAALTSGEAKPDAVVQKREDNKMENVEVRSTLEYGQAFLRGIKADDYTEARALLTEGVSGGVVPVPTQLDNEIRNAWEENQVLSLVKKTQFKGDMQVVFEVSATGAVIHVEGTTRPEEETLVLGSVTLKAVNVKKWISVSDEAIEGTTIDTIGYIYKELAQKIAEKVEEEIVAKIVAEQAATDRTHPGVPSLAQNIAVDTIMNAEALLSAKAKNIYILMNRQTRPAFAKLALEAGYAIDVFDGLKDKIVFTDKLPAFSAASSTDTYVIVGDFGYGYQANMPNGNNITIKRDDLSLAEYDLVKLVGKMYIGHGVVAPKAFVKITKVEG